MSTSPHTDSQRSRRTACEGDGAGRGALRQDEHDQCDGGAHLRGAMPVDRGRELREARAAAPVAVPAWGGPSGPPGPHPHPTSTTHEYEHGIRPWDGPRRLLSNGRISALFSAVGDSAGRRTGASPGTGASEAQTCDTRSGSLCAGASPGPLPNAVEERETPSNGGRADCATWQRRPRDARAGLLSFSWR